MDGGRTVGNTDDGERKVEQALEDVGSLAADLLPVRRTCFARLPLIIRSSCQTLFFVRLLQNPHYGMGEITIRLSTSVTPGADQQAVSSAACFSA